MNSKFIKIPVILSSAVLGLTACNDWDFGVTGDTFKKKEYAENFEKVFGKIDPEQDWSMALQVSANVSGLNDGLMEVYYSCPIGQNPIILAYANVEGGEASFKFDVTKGTKQVYVRVGDGNGNFSLKGYFDIVDGELIISNDGTRAMRYDITPLTGTATGVTKSASYNLQSGAMIDWTRSSEFYLQSYENLNSTEQLTYIDGMYYFSSQNQGLSQEYYTTGTISNFYNVYDVLKFENRPWWYASDVAHYFEDIDGEQGVFKESENHVVLMKEGAVPHLEKDLVFEIAEGGGPFYLDYFFKGTKYNNQFGYFYFKDTDLQGGNKVLTREQFLTWPKYVVIDDMSGKSGALGTVRINSTETRAWDLLRNQAPGALTPGIGIDGLDYGSESIWDTKIIGTRIPFIYWGEDGNTPSYTFPEGTKIGLFFIGNVDDNRENEVITSISKLNLDIYNEPPHAASFKWDNEVVFALEDMKYGGDRDINDAMFIASGNFKKEVIPHIRPVTPQGQTWIMACEDLGGTFDYDFNDLVFGIRKTPQSNGTKSDLYFVPLASGGTLDAKVYYNDGTDKLIGEMHNLVKAGAPTTEPLNVTAGSKPFEGNPIRIGEIDNEVSVNTIAAKFKIVVTRSDETTGTADSDDINIGFAKGDTYKAPQVLLLPSGWDWPSENTPITEVYPKFKDWAKNASVVAWCAKSEIKAGSSFVYDPVAKAPVQVDPGSETPETPGTGEGGEGGSGSVTPTPTDGIWNITLSGATANAETNTAYVEKGKSIELSINIEGVDDLSTLNISCSSYSGTTYITVPAYNNDGKVHITGNAVGSARVAVVIEGDDDHQKTRKEFLIVVTDRMPEWTLKINGEDATDGITMTEGTNTTNVVITIASLGNDTWAANQGKISYSIEDTSIATVTGNTYNATLTAVAPGETYFVVTHEADPGFFSELVKKYKLTIEEAGEGSDTRLEPDFTLSITEAALTVNGTTTFTMTADKTDVNTTGWICESEDETVATVSNFNKTYGAATIKGISKGQTRIKVISPSTDTYKSKTVYIDVLVGDLSFSDTNISTCIGNTKVTDQKDQWNEQNLTLIPIDLSKAGVDWNEINIAQLVIEGSTTGYGLGIFGSDYKYMIDNLSFNNAFNLPANMFGSSFYIGCRAGDISVTKLTLKIGTISIE